MSANNIAASCRIRKCKKQFAFLQLVFYKLNNKEYSGDLPGQLVLAAEYIFYFTQRPKVFAKPQRQLCGLIILASLREIFFAQYQTESFASLRTGYCNN